MRVLLIILLALVVLAAVVGVGGWLWWRGAVGGIDPDVLVERYMTPADRLIEVDGVTVRVREEGPEDAPPLVLLHGFAVSLESWDGWAQALSDDFRVIRFDLAGHGMTSPDPAERYAPDTRTAFTADVFDALGLERAHVAGNSLGGLIAWRLAASRPDLVDRLVLVDAGAYPFGAVTETPQCPPAALEAGLRTGTEAFARASLEYIFVDDTLVTDARVTLMSDMMRREGNGDALVEHICQFALGDPEPELARVRAPTLILWGAGDALIPVDHAQRLEAAISNARTVIYEGVGHAPQEEAPDRTAADARAFLSAR